VWLGQSAVQHPAEFAPLLALYHDHQPRRVLEVGAGHGATLYHWLGHAPAGALVVSLDDQHRNQHLYDEWIPAGVELVVITGNSHHPDVIAQARARAPYDFIFIDADHHAVDVRADWLHYGEMTRPGSVVAFHDITPNSDPNCEVDQLWRELRDTYDTAELATSGGNGIGMVLLP
jgi:predicted O-methyltransferase YrrM